MHITRCTLHTQWGSVSSLPLLNRATPWQMLHPLVKIANKITFCNRVAPRGARCPDILIIESVNDINWHSTHGRAHSTCLCSFLAFSPVSLGRGAPMGQVNVQKTSQRERAYELHKESCLLSMSLLSGSDRNKH